ncbi:non-ribosomal peptide synthetase [Paenibacillus donghaensis]|uniref:Carrier domain-containing protein n=1 Tax=Paenibacillus donghaensis TaxID=414771 RepID=A0A2Z2K4B3_9BACL|nr:non-ribosomal peptide synthetase [Paenibacillus donghaensis]ASA20596.1 hypothetical protein B9T62_07175 [Paenibacillus donghaensis]
MTRFRTLVEAIRERSSEVSIGITFIAGDDEETFVSYKDLYEKAALILGVLQANGVQSGDELVLQIEDQIDFVTFFWACILGRIIPVPVTIGNNDEHRNKVFQIMKILNNPFLATSKRQLAYLEKYAESNDLNGELHGINAKTLLVDQMQPVSQAGQIEPLEDFEIVFIQFSSGSTGEPKGVILTHDNLLANIYASIKCSGTSRQDSMLTWMPLTHDMGMIGSHMLPLVAGINQYLIPTSLFIRRPTLWLKKTSEHQATILSSPNFGFRYLLSFYKPESNYDWDLSHVKIIYNGAEPISTELCHEFLDQMSRYGLKETVIFPVYGLAEASVAVSFPVPGEELKEVNLDRRNLNVLDMIRNVDPKDADCITLVEVGSPVDDCLLRICDTQDNVLNEKTVGEIQISGRNVTSGYYRNQEATDRILTGDGWLRTGDLGFLQNGKLVITGRLKDIIFINGQNYYPYDIERIVEQIDGAKYGGVAACGVFDAEQQKEEIVVFVIHKKKLEEFLDMYADVKKWVGRQLGVEVKDVIPLRRLPKTTSGKIQRYKLADEYSMGLFNDISLELKQLANRSIEQAQDHLPVNGIEHKLLQIWSCVLQVEADQISVNDNFFEIGGNSTLMVQMISYIDADYPGTINITDPFETPTIKGLAEHIDSASRKQEPSQSITLLELPETFFVDNNASYLQSPIQEYSFVMEEQHYSMLRDISANEAIGVQDVLVLLFAFAVSQIAGVQSVPLQVLHDEGRIYPVTVDFSQTMDFSRLLQEVLHIRKGGSGSGRSIHAFADARILKSERSVLALVYSRSNLNSNLNLMEIFDITGRIDEYEDTLTFICEYNALRLSKEGMGRVVSQYQKLIETLISQYVLRR